MTKCKQKSTLKSIKHSFIFRFLYKIVQQNTQNIFQCDNILQKYSLNCITNIKQISTIKMKAQSEALYYLPFTRWKFFRFILYHFCCVYWVTRVYWVIECFYRLLLPCWYLVGNVVDYCILCTLANWNWWSTFMMMYKNL